MLTGSGPNYSIAKSDHTRPPGVLQMGLRELRKVALSSRTAAGISAWPPFIIFWRIGQNWPNRSFPDRIGKSALEVAGWSAFVPKDGFGRIFKRVKLCTCAACFPHPSQLQIEPHLEIPMPISWNGLDPGCSCQYSFAWYHMLCQCNKAGLLCQRFLSISAVAHCVDMHCPGSRQKVASSIDCILPSSTAILSHCPRTLIVPYNLLYGHDTRANRLSLAWRPSHSGE